MKFDAISDQVLVARTDIVEIGPAEVAALKKMAHASPAGRARICAHSSTEDRLHEMLIAVTRRQYFRPHAHQGKSESFYVIEGRLTIVLFDEHGEIRRLIDVSTSGDDVRFCRIASQTFHTVLLRSETVLFQETTNGPLDPRHTSFAPWAPDPSDVPSAARYYDDLWARVASFRGTP